MVFEWLAREGWIVVSWWALVTLAGAAVLPLCSRLLGALPDKGYTLARAVGMLLTGFVFWLLSSFGFLRNDNGGILLAWLLTLVLALTVYLRGDAIDWRAWWRENRSVVMLAEVLFLVLLIGWAIFRAHQNEIRTTEKPMDLMFLNSIMRSPQMPPNDGWMSGYSISYYYFGYLMAAMLSKLSGIPASAGYNMTNVMVFSLTGLTAFGVAYNLVRSRALRDLSLDPDAPTPACRPALFAGVLALVMVALMGNWQMALVEFPYQARIASESYLEFTATQARDEYPERTAAREAGIPDSEPVTLSPGRPDPTTWEWWWWFRASRVLQDFDLNGEVAQVAQPINEFPQFSFLLSDNHPHVMALPFVLLVLGLALNLLLTRRAPNRDETLLYGLAAGALVFLNTWDGPIYIAALVGAEGLRRLMSGQGRLQVSDWWALVRFGLTLALLTVIFYLPFLISFRSQASGLLPNIITPTLLQHFVIMFGPFIVILGCFLSVEAWRAGWRMNWRWGVLGALGLFVALALVMIALIIVALLVPQIYSFVVRFAEPYGGLAGALPLVLGRRLETLLTTLVLLAGFLLIIGRLFPRRSAMADDADRDARQVVTYPPATGFALLAAALGLGLCLVPEFFYLRDNFGTRINTIFKFYLQAWVLFSIASAYGVYTLLADSRLRLPSPALRGLFGAAAFVAIVIGLPYPLFGVYSRMFNPGEPATLTEAGGLTLDGGRTVVTDSDYQSIRCWENLIGDRQLVVVEALGGAYNPNFGRVAGLTGVPLVLGWENHERQWRGATYDVVAGTRGQDIPRLYTDLRWEVASEIIASYGIDYVFYGSSERSTYSSVGEEKFIENMEQVCPVRDADGRILSVFYRVTDDVLP